MADFEAGRVPLSGFDHEGHLRLAYTLLCLHDFDNAFDRMVNALKRYSAFNDVPPEKFHVTITAAWLHAVYFFMGKSVESGSFKAFKRCAMVLNGSAIMSTHYTKDRLFSDRARTEYLEPDFAASPVPVHL